MENNSLTSSVFNFDNSYARLESKLYSLLDPVKVKSPSVVLWNESLARESGVNISADQSDEIAAIFSGNRLPEGSKPLAQAYAGHQFGHFTMLGDGRAILLGEQITPEGKCIDIQLKGSGQTPYSRRGDGRATLYSMLREYLISEAMHHLGVPTSRSLAVVATGESVFRETAHQGAVLTRIASSHIRVGTFEYIRYLQPHLLKEFTDYTIQRHFPEISEAENPAMELFRRVIEKQSQLVAHWIRTGFIHGVMNTDNSGIPGETFDYGPCAFINDYHPRKVFSSIDQYGRYAFGNQASIMQWNLGCFAVTLLPLIDRDEKKAIEKVKQELEGFENLYGRKYSRMMCSKLGIADPQPNDAMLVDELLNWMQDNKADYTNTFLYLENGEEVLPKSQRSVYELESFKTWQLKWQQRVNQNSGGLEEARELMQKTNPLVIPRNHIVEEVLEAAVNNDLEPFNRFLKVLSTPYARSVPEGQYLLPPPHGDEGYQTFCGT